MTDERNPFTDEELARLEHVATTGQIEQLARLVAAVRRLRALLVGLYPHVQEELGTEDVQAELERTVGRLGAISIASPTSTKNRPSPRPPHGP